MPEGVRSWHSPRTRGTGPPPGCARGPGGRAGGDPVHGPIGHGLPAAGVGHRLGGRAPAGLGELRRRPRGLRVRHRPGAAGLRPAQGQADHPRPGQAPGRATRAARSGRCSSTPAGRAAPGVDFVQAVGPFLYSDEVRARFDLVGFDPRGIIRSTPLRCFETFDEALADRGPVRIPGHPGRRSGSGSSADRALARACAERGGPILDHMSTANVARDMDLLRRAVGDAQADLRRLLLRLAIWRHLRQPVPGQGPGPGRRRRARPGRLVHRPRRPGPDPAVLDPPAQRRGRLRHPAGVPAPVRRRRPQLRLLRRQPQAALRPAGPAAAARARPSSPTRHGGTFPVTYADLVGTTLGALYDPAAWPDLAEFLQALDDADQPGGGRARLCGPCGPGSAPASSRRTYPNFVEGFPGVACSETHNPSTVGAWSRAAEGPGPPATPTSAGPGPGSPAPAQPWPGWDATTTSAPGTTPTANPVLVVGNRFDPATRYQGAVTVDRLLPRSRLLTLAGWGHTSLFASACIDAYVSPTCSPAGCPPRARSASRTWCRSPSRPPPPRPRGQPARPARRP